MSAIAFTLVANLNLANLVNKIQADASYVCLNMFVYVIGVNSWKVLDIIVTEYVAKLLIKFETGKLFRKKVHPKVHKH